MTFFSNFMRFVYKLDFKQKEEDRRKVHYLILQHSSYKTQLNTMTFYLILSALFVLQHCKFEISLFGFVSAVLKVCSEEL